MCHQPWHVAKLAMRRRPPIPLKTEPPIMAGGPETQWRLMWTPVVRERSSEMWVCVCVCGWRGTSGAVLYPQLTFDTCKSPFRSYTIWPHFYEMSVPSVAIFQNRPFARMHWVKNFLIKLFKKWTDFLYEVQKFDSMVFKFFLKFEEFNSKVVQRLKTFSLWNSDIWTVKFLNCYKNLNESALVQI